MLFFQVAKEIQVFDDKGVDVTPKSLLSVKPTVLGQKGEYTAMGCEYTAMGCEYTAMGCAPETMLETHLTIINMLMPVKFRTTLEYENTQKR